MSPDHDMTKNLWRVEIAIGERSSANIQELEQITVEELEKLLAGRCRKLMDSNKHLEAVIFTKGHATKHYRRVF